MLLDLFEKKKEAGKKLGGGNDYDRGRMRVKHIVAGRYISRRKKNKM